MRNTKKSAIVNYIKQNPGITQKELVVALKINRKTVMNTIMKLCADGVILNKPDAGKIRPGKYYLAENVSKNVKETTSNSEQETVTEITTPSEKLRSMVSGMVVRCPGITCRQISEKLGANTTTVWSILKEMVNNDIVRSVTSGTTGGAIRYYYNYRTVSKAEKQSEETKTTKEMKSEPIKSKVIEEKSNSERKSDLLRNLTSRELMVELRDRGYTGKLYIKREIDIEAL